MPPYGPAKETSGKVLSLRPLLAGGVDLFTDSSSLADQYAAQMRNCCNQRGPVERRKGALKLQQFTDVTASRTFGTDAKYATFTPPLIPAGGFAVLLHFTIQALEVPSGNTGWVVGSRPSGQSYHVFKVTNGDNGAVTLAWRTSGGATHSVTLTNVSDGLNGHVLAVYDAMAGTYTCYLNGAVSGTPITGLASDLKPAQDAGVVWTFGVEKQTGSAVTAGSAFPNKIDGMTIFTLRGTRPASGTYTLAALLKKHSARCWPAPQMDCVLAHYDMDEASGAVMYDRSNNKNHGTYVGGPSVTAPVALTSMPTNYIAAAGLTSAQQYNLVGNFGRLFYERTS